MEEKREIRSIGKGTHVVKYIVCEVCGKKVRRATAAHKLCSDCRLDANLKKKGKAYQDEVKRLQQGEE